MRNENSTLQVSSALSKFGRRSRDLASLLKWRVNRPSHPPGPLRLHLGCGAIDYAGFVNIDGRPHRHVHHVQGLDALDNFAADSAELIYACHCLEHIPRTILGRVFLEWARVLKKGGIARISVPDFDLLVDIYLDNQRNIDSIQMPLMGAQDYPLNFHYVAFNERYLRTLLLGAGFEDVRRWTPGEDDWARIPDWSNRTICFDGKNYPVSLNLQASRT